MLEFILSTAIEKHGYVRLFFLRIWIFRTIGLPGLVYFEINVFLQIRLYRTDRVTYTNRG